LVYFLVYQRVAQKLDVGEQSKKNDQTIFQGEEKIGGKITNKGQPNHPRIKQKNNFYLLSLI